MRTKSIIKAEEKLNRFNHIEINFKLDSMQKCLGDKYKFEFGHHIDSDYKQYHNEIHLLVIPNLDASEAFNVSEYIRHAYQLETYYHEPAKHLEITLYQYLS